MKRFLIIVAVLALIVPGALLAQGGIPRERLAGITLENLAGALANLTERVEALEDTQALDAMEQRIQVLEEALAEMEVSPAQLEGEACLVIGGGGAFMPLGNQLRPETVDEYLEQFGEIPGDPVVKDARLYPESGILEVRYNPLLPGTPPIEKIEKWQDDSGAVGSVIVIGTSFIEIIEKWQGCEFLGVEFKKASIFD